MSENIQSEAWSGLWCSRNKLDGVSQHLLYFNGVVALFSTRRKAREFIEREYGYIKTRRDLRTEPHGWRVPKPIKVTITAERKTEEVNHRVGFEMPD